jgi:hypothetical protein
MPGYDEDRSNIHTEMEQAAKESRDKAEERYAELQANRVVDMSDENQVRGRRMGNVGAVYYDPEIRANLDALTEDPLSTQAVVPPRHSQSGEWEVDESKIGGEGGGGTPVQAKRSSRAKSSEASESS